MTKTTTSVAVSSSHRIARGMHNVMLVFTARQMMGVVRTALASTSKKREITVLQTFLAKIGVCATTRTRRIIKVFALRGSPLVHTKSSMMGTIQSCAGQTIPWTPQSARLACQDLSWTVPLLDCLMAISTATTTHLQNVKMAKTTHISRVIQVVGWQRLMCPSAPSCRAIEPTFNTLTSWRHLWTTSRIVICSIQSAVRTHRPKRASGTTWARLMNWGTLNGCKITLTACSASHPTRGILICSDHKLPTRSTTIRAPLLYLWHLCW